MKPILRFYYYYACITTLLTNYIYAQSTFIDNISLKIIGEQIINPDFQFQNTKVGGLSSIDYANNRWFSICDDSNAPLRYYELELLLNDTSFNAVHLKKVHFLKDDTG